MSSARVMRRRLQQNGRLGPVPTVEEATRELAADSGPPVPEGGEWPRYFHGAPGTVRERLTGLAQDLRLGELMIVTIVHDHRVRLRSYELLAQAFGLSAQDSRGSVPG
jgi:alkanesulfonate monooxygenase SsuD/methylene tetrahydromethanopterin reductase-like flavin-dependent oxidoreductase (luciferase family)